MVGLERRLFVRTIAIGIGVTVAVLGASAAGLLDTLENWLYDQRALYCQIASRPPTTRISHIDIDDASLEAIGRWPWPREQLARILEEIERAKPGEVGLDIIFSEPQKSRLEQDARGRTYSIDGDDQLARVIEKSGNMVLATSFRLEPPDAQTPLLTRAQSWFNTDLEISPDEFSKKLIENGFTGLNASVTDDLFLRARRQAMSARVDQELNKGIVPLKDLLPRLLPHADAKIESPLNRLMVSQYTFATAAWGIHRFGTPSQTLSSQAAQGTLSVLPLPGLSRAADGCGFVNYDISATSEIRSVPLFVEYNHRLYPQMGLETACRAMGADPTDVRFEGSQIIIPSRSGPISIPTFVYHSKTLGRDVPLIAAIPWFGGRDWESMYDWPAHKNNSSHISIGRIWDICTAQDTIAINNENIDRAISQILSDDTEDKLRLDPALAKTYAATVPAPLDTSARHAIVSKTLEQLKSSGWLEQYRKIPDAELSKNERFQRDKLYDANDALNKLVPENEKLAVQVQSQRDWLGGEIAGKAIFVGFTATAMDRVATSLHNSCPGVVVHGVVANAVITGDWWQLAPNWMTSLMTVVFGIGTALALGRLSPLRATALAMALLIGYAFLNGLVIFGWRKWIVNAASPMTAIVAVWAAVTLYRLIVETIERYRIATEVAVISREMELARQVQVALIPASPPKLQGLEAEGWALPASQTGGDCYDLWELADGRLAILVADASGHGLAPAMIVSQVRTLMRAMCEFESHPRGLLSRVNTRVSADLEANRFITAFLGFISTDGQLDWASAGHGPMYWCSSIDGEIIELDSTGMPLGIQADWLADPPAPPLQLNSSGLLVVFSDGINEARAPSGEMFGTDRVKVILKESAGRSSAEIIEAMRGAVQKFQEKAEPIDDQTVVIVRKIDKSGTI